MDVDYVRLCCIKVGSKLRVRILTDGYFKDANCQFPRALRVEGREFKVHKDKVRLVQRAAKYYYSISKKDVEIIENEEILQNITIYEDEQDTECIICFDEDKSVVLVPCGHYCLCVNCADRIRYDNCPMCRTPITQVVSYQLIG